MISIHHLPLSLFLRSSPNKIKPRFQIQPSMISILAQERLLGATLGIAFTSFIVFEQRKLIHDSIADRNSQSIDQSQVRDGILGKKYRMELASLWNKAVDQTFEPAIEFLSSRKW